MGCVLPVSQDLSKLLQRSKVYSFQVLSWQQNGFPSCTASGTDFSEWLRFARLSRPTAMLVLVVVKVYIPALPPDS